MIAALAGAACGSAPEPVANSAPRPADPYDEQLELMTRYIAQTCACATRACADQVVEAYRARFDVILQRMTGVPTDAQIARHKQLARQYDVCFDRMKL